MGKKLAMILGWVFVVIGVLGFIPNPIVGSADGAIFSADTMHNLVHLILGIVLLWAVYKSPMKVGMTLKVVGVIYLLVAILGFLSSSGSVLGLIMVNGADNWLHLIVGLLALWGGMKGNGGSMGMGGQM